MPGQLQPKQLSELAFSSFSTYAEKKVRELVKIARYQEETDLTWLEALAKTLEISTDLKHLIHDTKLPSCIANELTKRLLIMLHNVPNSQLIGSHLVEIIMHPDVTEIQMCPTSLHLFYDYHSHWEPINIGNAILNQLRYLHNFKKLDLRFSFFNGTDKELVLPSKITEFTLNGYSGFKDKQLKILVESCPELKILKLTDCDISSESIPMILKCKHLKALQLLETKLMDEDYVALINAISTDTATDKLSASTITSFGLTCREGNTLRTTVDKLPNLTEMVLNVGYGIDLSCLTELKNLRSLSLKASCGESERYKKILSALGKDLVLLSLTGYSNLDIEFIGETCSNLKTLHLEAMQMQDSQLPLKTLPNLKKVECLEVAIPYCPVLTECLAENCTNVKELYVISGFSLHNIIAKIIDRTPLNNLKRIEWSIGRHTDGNSAEELRSKCPNVLVVRKQRPHIFESCVIIL